MSEFHCFKGDCACDLDVDEAYSVGYNESINDAIKFVNFLIDDLDIRDCTKYRDRNKDSSLYAKAFDTLMKYEIMDSVKDLLDRLKESKKKVNIGEDLED